MGVNRLAILYYGQMERREKTHDPLITAPRKTADAHTLVAMPRFTESHVRDDASTVGEGCHGKEAAEKAGDD